MSNPWYGVVNGVNFVSCGPVSDPILEYKGHEFNYWDIENVIFEMFRDYLRDNFAGDEFLESINFEVLPDDDFTEWLSENNDTVTNYLDECISGGYFQN